MSTNIDLIIYMSRSRVVLEYRYSLGDLKLNSIIGRSQELQINTSALLEILGRSPRIGDKVRQHVVAGNPLLEAEL